MPLLPFAATGQPQQRLPSLAAAPGEAVRPWEWEVRGRPRKQRRRWVRLLVEVEVVLCFLRRARPRRPAPLAKPGRLYAAQSLLFQLQMGRRPWFRFPAMAMAVAMEMPVAMAMVAEAVR